MRYFLICVFLFGVVGLNAQKVTFFNEDSIPVKNVLVANMVMDESVFSNKAGEADLTIFQDDDELLQVLHQAYKTIVIPKNLLLEQSKIFLEKETNKIDAVQVNVSSKTKESTYELITQSKSISKENIQHLAPGNSADMLASTGQVQIQKSQLGGGSPILRGFEASRVLLVVDGVRMNNAIYRSGHLQNALSVDPNLLEGTEVIFGPNSLIYGSDALGGVIHFKTRDPRLKLDSSRVEQIDGVLRYQSALGSKTANFNYQNGTKKFAYLVGVTRNEFDDLKMGTNRFHGFNDFGKFSNYVTQFEGVDSMVVNQNENVVKNSGYTQTDLLWKGLYKPGEFTKYKLNFQFSTTSEVPRVDKLNEYRNGILRYGEWYYGPQNRTLMSVSSETERKTKFFDYNNNIFAYQLIEEDRISREYKSLNQENNEEDVHVYSFNSDFIKYLDSSRTVKLNYGAELLYNNVVSEAFIKNTATGNKSFLATRYPGAGSIYTSGAVYAALQKKIGNHLLKGGLRYTATNIVAKFDTNEIINLLNITQKELTAQSITSSAGYVYHKGNYKFYSSISSAFKTPNVDDFGKIFEKRGDLTIPNPLLKPETSVNYEIGSNYMHQYVDFDAAVFYTQVFNLMTKLSANLNGDSTINLNGDDLNLVSVQNGGTANIYGLFGAVRVKFNDRLNWHSTATLTKAHFPNKEGAVAHIPPFYGRTSLNYKMKKVKLALYSRFNGRKNWDDFDPLNDNPDESVIDFGSPAWMTLNASMFVYLYNDLKLQVAAENLLDAHYKTFASGISAPGRNIIASVYFKF